MKTSVISEDFRNRFLSNSGEENILRAKAVVFEGPEDYHNRLNDPELNIDEKTILFIRGVGCVGYPGSAEVVICNHLTYYLRKVSHIFQQWETEDNQEHQKVLYIKRLT